ncbi:MAG: hypothetical protein WA958_12830 [Tunicatimonas sp.]
MITIVAQDPYIQEVTDAINQVPRLSELAQVRAFDEDATAPAVLVDERGVVVPQQWNNAALPYLLPSPLPLQRETLLGMVFNALGNGERAQQYLEARPDLRVELAVCHCLRENLPVSTFLAQELERRQAKDAYRYNHNVALLKQYGLWPEAATPEAVQQQYQRALAAAPDDEHYAFTLKQYVTLLLDTAAHDEAETLLRQHIPQTLSEAASFALRSLLISVRMARLAVPYDPDHIEELKNLLADTLAYYETQQQSAEVGWLLMDASEVANITESYAESLGYINRALNLFRAEDLPELAASSLLRKGELLYTWAQNDNPQFYKPAIDTFQEALRVFKRDEVPHTFAQIHLHLGGLYAEMATKHPKKALWAAVSATSFQEALNYFSAEETPYAYGLACNNYANALIKYPTALREDNFEKALHYYEEALRVRTVDYPYERTLTLLNFLEASWRVSNDEAAFNQERYDDMVRKAEEVKTLVEDPNLRAEADRHLEQLAYLEEIS